MVEVAVKLLDDDTILLRRAGVRFPVELRPPAFEPDDLSTWPDAEGRLEWVGGRLLYMWIVLPEQREVVVLRDDEESRCARNQCLPEAPELPGLAPSVRRFFAQLDRP